MSRKEKTQEVLVEGCVAAKIAGLLPFGFTNSFSKIASLGADVASALGYSRLPAEATMVVVSRKTDNLNVIEGQFDAGATLGTNDVALVSQAVSPLKQVGETNINVFGKMRTQVLANWAQSRTVNIYPGVVTNITIHDDVVAEMFTNNVSFLAMSFGMWSGAMKFCVEVIASPLVRGRMGVVIIPPNEVIPASFPTNGSYLTSTFDVVGTTCVEFDVPYWHERPFMPTRITPISAIEHNEATIRYFWIAGPFDLGATRAPDVNLYMWTGDDCIFAVPDTTLCNSYDVLYTQGKGDAATADIYGEIIEDLNTLARRKAYSQEVVLSEHDASVVVWPKCDDQQPSMPFMYWYALAFHAVAGSLSFTLECDVDAPMKAFEGKTARANDQTRGCVYMHDKIIQFRLPDRCGFHFWSPYMDHVSPLLAIDPSVIKLKSPYPDTFQISLHRSGGDDFSMSGFLCTPSLKVRE